MSFYRMAGDENPSLLRLIQSDEASHDNQGSTKCINMPYPQDGMRYRGETRGHEGHQVTRYLDGLFQNCLFIITLLMYLYIVIELRYIYL